ncbi:UNVERIFIED_CONTAM: Double-stranded RNA-specific editase B2 [Gekko kuhli]
MGLKGSPVQVGLNIRQAQVIVLTSGTKCINGEYINDQGLVVNDCHAEIVARRAFLHFLYSQLELHLSELPYGLVVVGWWRECCGQG